MTYTMNLRSQIYEPLEALKEPFNRALSYLKSFRCDYYAERASKLIKRAFSVLKRILNYRCDDHSTIIYLEDISRLLNIVVIRTEALYPQIAKVAYDLYQQFTALFPGELSLQLELFDYGEIPPLITDDNSLLIFPSVKRFLNYWLTPFTEQQQVTRWHLAQRRSSPFKRIEGEQLCLDFSGTSQKESPTQAVTSGQLEEVIAQVEPTVSDEDEVLTDVTPPQEELNQLEGAKETPTLADLLGNIDLEQLQLRPARKIAKFLGIAQKVNGKDQPLAWLRVQIKKRLQR